jgi:uncharacterized protein YktA (UPF0223 family)
MYDRITQQGVPRLSGREVPAGALCPAIGGMPYVHRHAHDRGLKTPDWSGEWISPPVDDKIRIRFSKFSEEIRKESLLFYEDPSELLLTTFEEVLSESICHLQEIVARPVLSLNREELKLPVSRVKRFSSRAIPELACHSEDWLRRTFISVVPNRLMAEVQSDQWDTYENRFMVSFCEKIERFLEKRLRENKQLKNAYEEIQSICDNPRSVSEDLRERFMKRIDSYFGGRNRDSEESSLSETRKMQENLLQQLKQMKNSELFRHVRPNLNLSSIHMTNLLQNDQHYRHLVILHNAWVKEREGKASDEQFESNQGQLMDGVADYLECCCRDSLRGMGFTNLGKRSFRHLTNSLRVTVRRGGAELVLKESLENRSIRFVALPADPGEYYTLTKSNDPTIIVYPSGDGSGPKLLSLSQSLSADGEIRSIPLSPLSLYSEEMVAGILFRWLFAHQFMHFPARVSKVPSVVQQFIESDPELSLCHVNGGGNEVNFVDIPIWFNDAEAILEERLQEFCRVKRIQQLQLPKDTIKDVSRGFRSLSLMFTCPKCHQMPQRNERSGRGFELRCYSCGQFRWGSSDGGKWFVRTGGDADRSDIFLYAGRFSSR